MERERRQYNCNTSNVTVIFGDITESKMDVIASSDDTQITMSGGVSSSICQKGGKQILFDARKQLPATIGDVIVSSAGELSQKYIFHCLTIDEKYLQETWAGLNIPEKDKVEKIIRDTIRKSFNLLKALNIYSIAFPIIGSGAAHMPFLFVVEIMADEISQQLIDTNKKFNIEIYIYGNLENYDTNRLDFYSVFSSKFAIANYIIQQNRDAITYKANSIKLSEDELQYYKNQQHEVFISYKREETSEAFAIKELLDSWGIKTWIDKNGIFSSFDFKEVIEKAIENSKIVLFLSSEKSNQSPYVKQEIKYAIGCKKRVIPVMLDNSPFGDGLRIDLLNVDQIDYNNAADFQKKLKTSIDFILRTSTD